MSPSSTLLLSFLLLAGEPVNQAPQAAAQQEPFVQATPQAPPSHQAMPQSAHAASKGRSGSAAPIPVSKIKVEIFTTKDGKSGWKARIPGRRALATPAVVDGMAYVWGGGPEHNGPRSLPVASAKTAAPATTAASK